MYEYMKPQFISLYPPKKVDKLLRFLDKIFESPIIPYKNFYCAMTHLWTYYT